jgi:hypothetical protein
LAEEIVEEERVSVLSCMDRVILGNLFFNIAPAFCTLLELSKKTRSTTPAYLFPYECKQRMK